MPKTNSTTARSPKRFWYPAALAALTMGTVAAYLVNLTANGWANSFYAAAVQAGSESWKAFLFGSLDASNAITVDKPPASLWLMALSARVFGFSSFSMLLPQVLLAGLSVLMIVHSVRLTLHGRTSDGVEKSAALGAGLLFALQPVAALMFRFNNPDALLVALMIGAVVATQHALRALAQPAPESQAAPGLRSRTTTAAAWLVVAGVCLGLGFLTKQFQVLLIVPGLALAWVLFARTTWPKRFGALLIPIASMAVSAGWWIALVELMPEDSRPYVGGSQNNSFLELTLGYNGFGRLTGNEVGSVGGGPGGGNGGGGQWGETGITRLLTGSFGQQVSWLLPTALVLLIVTAVLLTLTQYTRRADKKKASGASSEENPGNLGAGLLMWGAWLVVTWLVLSYMSGIVHEYYTVALTPAIAAVIGIAVAVLCSRGALTSRLILAVVWALTGAWQFIVSAQMTGIPEWLRWAVLVVSLVGALALISTAHRRLRTAVVAGLVALAIVSAVAMPGQLTARTIASSAHGSIVTIAGTSSGMGGGPGGGPGGPGGGGQPPSGGEGSHMGNGPGGGQPPSAGEGSSMEGGPGGGAGSLLNGSEASDELAQVLEEDASSYTWIAATTGANQAAGYQLATGEPVMAIGGFNGTDPSPTLEQFKTLVAEGKIHYYISSGNGDGPGGGPGGGSSGSSDIATWVEENYQAISVDGVVLYDLSQGG